MRQRSAWFRAKLPKTRRASVFLVALLAGAVLGPLTGMAIGEAGHATTVVTETATCPTTTTVKTVALTTTYLTTTTTPVTTTITETTVDTTVTPPTTTTTPVVTTVDTTTTTPTTTVTKTTTTSTSCKCPSGSKTVTTPGTATQPPATTVTATTISTPTTTTTATSTTGSGGTGIGGTPTTTTTATTPTTTTAPPNIGCTTTTTVTVPPYVAPTNTAKAPAVIAVPKKNALARHGMWIWLLSATDHGSVPAIIAQAKADGIGTLIIKNGDGRSLWSQFNKTLVTEIHAAGLKVCAWQYVYGNYPSAEAQIGADAKKDGADCLVIDAEVQYQGRYVAAQAYMKDLRKLVGKTYPVGLAGLPYIQYHTNFPYSIFLGTNGAQYNLPQMYWIDIGTTVPYVYSTTYEYNEIYQRPIFPLGQLYGDSEGSPNANSVGQFNTIAKDYKATGTSWWDFQSAASAWLADTNKTAAAPAKFVPLTNAATLVKGNTGDMVVWAQEHLDGAGANLAVDGDFGPATRSAVESFQYNHHLTESGQLDGKTWDALLKYKPASVTWSTRGKGVYATVTHAGRRTTSIVALTRASKKLALRAERR